MKRIYKQLFHYLDQLNQSHGYLVLFEMRNSDILPCDERIKWMEVDFESLGVWK